MNKTRFVNSKYANNPELLHDAVEKGYLKIVEDLLKHGADVNMLHISTFKEGFTPLHSAAKGKQEEVARLLISYKADINAQDENGKTPIFYAIENADSNMTKLLLTCGANVKDDPELLCVAVERGCIEIVEALLQHDVDINACDQIGRTALHFTAFSKNYSVFLRDTDVEDSDINTKAEIAKLLLSKGANVDAQNKNGLTALNYAIHVGCEKVVEALLEYNAKVKFGEKFGTTPLHFSARTGNEEITKMLLNKGADVNARTKDGTTALHIAIQNRHKRIVKLLLKFGAKVDSKKKGGSAPLHLVAETGDLEIIESLLKLGADFNSRDEKGRTALQIASKRGYEAAVETLLEYGSDMAGLGPFYYIRRLPDPRAYGCELTSEVFIRHITKMKTANLYANENDIPSISCVKVSGFEDECECEIVSMKGEKISNTNITFYDILAKSTQSLAKCMRNENIVQALKADECKTKFPIYANLIKSHFRKAMTRKKLLEQSNDICHILFHNLPKLHRDCTEKIFSYLSDKDLRNLTDACERVEMAQMRIG